MASIPYVRAQIVRMRHGSTRLTPTVAFQGLAALAAGGTVLVDDRALLGSGAVVALAVAQTVALRSRDIAPVKIIGLRQMAAGIAIVAAMAIGGAL